jgi:hypothetical protein
MRAAAEILNSLRLKVGARAAFVVDDLGRIVAFDTDPSLPPDALADLAARQISRAENMLQHVGERGAGIAWEVAPAQTMYVTELSEGLALAMLFGSPEIAVATVYGQVRSLRQELTTVIDGQAAS